ncbi:MAG: tRNA lysidine(34) synthetase TilS [Burkholderiales bacterium]|nr:MAG: tRNA lysidine(34) synthetase TilS [Burkholderiales bacterium]
MSDTSQNDDAERSLVARASRAFDRLAGYHQTIGLAVSGGSDSLALLMLGAAWARARGRDVIAATVDHGLRPEALAEAEGVAAICEQLGVRHDILTWSHFGRSGGAPGQAEARRARHALLAGWARMRDAGLIALGHTRDDRIETFLMRARKGSGWHGLAGPLPLAPSPVWPDGRGLQLGRPLLAFGREELRDELRARSLTWVEDPSNEAERYERVRTRQLVARLEPEARERIVRIMGAAIDSRVAALAGARAALDLCQHDGEETSLPLAVISGLEPDAKLRLVEALVMAAGGAETVPRREALERLSGRLVEVGGMSGGMTLAGAWVRRKQQSIGFSAAPPRRGADDAAPPAWDRAHALLADPAAEALGV